MLLSRTLIFTRPRLSLLNGQTQHILINKLPSSSNDWYKTNSILSIANLLLEKAMDSDLAGRDQYERLLFECLKNFDKVTIDIGQLRPSAVNVHTNNYGRDFVEKFLSTIKSKNKVPANLQSMVDILNETMDGEYADKMGRERTINLIADKESFSRRIKALEQNASFASKLKIFERPSTPVECLRGVVEDLTKT